MNNFTTEIIMDPRLIDISDYPRISPPTEGTPGKEFALHFIFKLLKFWFICYLIFFINQRTMEDFTMTVQPDVVKPGASPMK